MSNSLLGRNSKRASLIVCVLSAALALLCIITTPAVAAMPIGKELYQIHCASCHGLQLQGGPDAPPLIGVGAAAVDFYLSTGRMPAALGTGQASRGQPQLRPDQVNALIAYVTSRSGGSPIIPLVTAKGNIMLGRRLYIDNCAACHGASAQGGSVGYGWIAPSLRYASVIQVAEAIRIGPGVMPRYGPRELTDADVNAIVRYVNLLVTQPPSPGGLAMGYVGPVAEGLAAWILGMMILFFIVRSIGTKT